MSTAACFLLCWTAWTPGAAVAADDDAFFETKIRPVLATTCFKCHGGERTAAKLRVDSRDALATGGSSGPAVLPGEPDKSLLIRALQRHDDVAAMPPDKALPPQTVADFAAWVKAGARWPKVTAGFSSHRHWAFEPIRSTKPPDGAGNPIDRYFEPKSGADRLDSTNLADRRTLIRRVTFDLVGLPPTPEEVAAFENDARPGAFERVVDRLLASPHYGERWGRHWLDVARYADTAGETADFPVPQAWRYRNYVIDAFNSDKPYDSFVREQIAGDILAAKLNVDAPRERYAELVTATGFISVARRFGFDVLHDHFLTIEDTIDTFGKTFLGLTVGCARCHDHKYDPISSADYYALYGVFESTRYPHPGCEKNRVPGGLVAMRPPAEIDRMLKRIDAELTVFGPGAAMAVGMASVAAGEQRIRQRREAFLQSVDHAYAVAEGAPHDAALHKRGNPEERGPAVPRRFLQLFGGQSLPAGAGSGRLQLAEWLLGPARDLTARVMVNRIWQHHFGTGLVATASDFGTRGSRPTHPELLDFLAERFIASGWSVKSLHRLILSSRAYQRPPARPNPGRLAAEGAAQETIGLATLTAIPSLAVVLPAHQVDTGGTPFPRRRLSAEEVRDSILAVSGDLDRAPGKGHPFPPEPSWGFTQHAPFAAVYEHDRRSVYLMVQRIKRHPFLALFDGADPNASTGERTPTTVATQALFFLNDPFVHAKSASLARRLETCGDDGTRLDRAFRLLYSRPPTAAEVAAGQRFLAAYGADLPASSLAERRRTAWAAWLRVMMAGNEFIYVD